MSEEKSKRYLERGVSAAKEDVHAAVEKIDKGLFPKAFCKVIGDPFKGDEQTCTVIHSDGSGTKSILAYLHFRETGDPLVFAGIAQDSIVMNIDDLLCVGLTDHILLSSTINRNAKNCDGSVVSALINGNEHFIQKLKDLGLSIVSGGGETADMGDLVRTVSVDTCAVAQIQKSEVIGSGIDRDLCIVGLSSSGQATYEEEENSGIGSNGLTSARHELLSTYYRDKYSEVYAPEVDPKYVYNGPFRMDDALEGSSMTVGQALLSPTRTYAPVIKKLLDENREAVKAMVHCTGGAQSKCLRFGNGVHFIKDKLFDPPPVFKAIQKASKTSWHEMFQVYNMGHRMEIYCLEKDASQVIELSKSFGIDAKIIGRTEMSQSGKNHLTLKWGDAEYLYEL